MPNKNILIIDDSETSLILFRSLFENDEIVIHSEIDSRNAIQRIKVVKPDIIVLDLMMPEIDGFQILKTIKEDKVLMNIPVLVLSANHEAGTIKRAMQSGAVGFIKKPYIVNEVINIIHKQLSLLK